MMSRLAEASFVLKLYEGVFRSAHLRIRTYVESITFFNGVQKEQLAVENDYRSLMAQYAKPKYYLDVVFTSQKLFCCRYRIYI